MEGKSVDQVLSEMGTPKEVAERFNQEMKSPSKRKNFWSVIIVCVLGGIVLAGILGSMWFRFFKQQAVSIVGGADGPTSVFIAGKPGWNGYLISSIGFIFGCISAGLLCKYGKKAQKRSYVKCTVLSLVGLVCAFVPFLFPFLENLQWIFYMGVTEITLAPGLILKLITLCCSMVFMRKNEK